jgi:hypothetical protein
MTFHSTAAASHAAVNVTPASPLKSAMKQARRASLTSKFPRCSSFSTSDSWRTNGTTHEQRALRCKTLVAQALNALKPHEDDHDEFDQGIASSSTNSMRTSSCAPESLCGYGEMEVPIKVDMYKASSSSRPRYQRRCSVTEFSLKAAVLAKVQLARELELQRRR